MSTFHTECRGSTCHERVVMTDEITGKRHPFDPPTTCEACDGRGRLTVTHPPTLFDPAGSQSVETCKPCKGRGRIYVSHYKTCSNADEFRAPKESS